MYIKLVFVNIKIDICDVNLIAELWKDLIKKKREKNIFKSLATLYLFFSTPVLVYSSIWT